MQAFALYHPDEIDNTILRENFTKLRTARTNYVRALRRKNIISEQHLDELIRLVHLCNYQELNDIFLDLKNIPIEGVNLQALRNKISEKPNAPVYRKRQVQRTPIGRYPLLSGLTREELNLRKEWIAKGKRLLTKRCKIGQISNEEKAKIYNETFLLRTARDAENWYYNLLNQTYSQPNQPGLERKFCEHCPHCQELANVVSNTLGSTYDFDSSDSESDESEQSGDSSESESHDMESRE